MDLSLGFVNILSDCWLLWVSCMRQTTLLNPEHLVVLLAGPVSHTSIQYVDYVEISNIALDLSTIHLLALVGVELSLCVVVTPS